MGLVLSAITRRSVSVLALVTAICGSARGQAVAPQAPGAPSMQAPLVVARLPAATPLPPAAPPAQVAPPPVAVAQQLPRPPQTAPLPAPLTAPTAPLAESIPRPAPQGLPAPAANIISAAPEEPAILQVSARQKPLPDPEQPGNLNKYLEDVESRLNTLEGMANAPPKLPMIRMSGFFHLDQGIYDQSLNSKADLGNLQNGIGFRRARLQALGKLTEFTGYSLEFDFGIAGRPSFVDVWGEQQNLPFFGTIRIGQFRQPTTMDGWTSIRHLDFMERSLPFQALDPFRRVGIMAYNNSEDERTTWAYSVYATGFTFWNGVSTVYSTLGDTRFATQIGDHGGVSTALRGTHLLYYDEPSEGRYLLHIGGGYNFSQLGGNPNSVGTDARNYESQPIPEFFVGDPTGGNVTGAGESPVLNTGRIRATNFHYWHTEFAGNSGPAHFQHEFMLTALNQLNGPLLIFPGTYAQCGYFLTGESAAYNKQAGVLDYNVVPYSDFFGLGRGRGFGGWGAWEVAFRWSFVDLTCNGLNPTNQLSNVNTNLPFNPNYGRANESTLGVNWYWNRYARMQFNWIHSMPVYNQIAGQGFSGYAPFNIFAGRFQIEF